MSNQPRLVAVLSLTLSACMIPGLSGVVGLSTPSGAPHSGFTPAPAPVHPAPPPPVAAPSSGPSDDEIRAANSKAEHDRLDHMTAEREHEQDPNWGVLPEVQTAQDDLNWLHVVLGDGPGSAKQGAKLIADANACSASVAKQLAAGSSAATTILVRVTHGNTTKTPMSLVDANAKICQPLLARGQVFDAEHDAAVAKFEAPYRNAGLAGDKLELALREDDCLVTVGQRAVTTPADIARTSVFFVLQETNDHAWTLERYQFAGNKLVSHTRTGYVAAPGPNHYR